MRRIQVAAAIVSVAIAVTGCAGGGTPPGNAAPPPSSAPPASDVWHTRATPAASAKQVGMPDTCPMPVAFDIAQEWEVVPTAPGGSPRGGLSLACQVKESSGKAAFVRAWVGTEAGATPRGALEKFLGAEGAISDPQYRDTDVGMGEGVEVTYVKEQGARARAFAMVTPLRSVVVAVTADDATDYDKALPGYLLAKDSLTPTER
ncbi:lipoprotein [Actinokineospora sp.]|uniref:lipoprotein n=1 Tax=Actinokineospora sp. TaxID=1872133 RepID=UPI003D6C603A